MCMKAIHMFLSDEKSKSTYKIKYDEYSLIDYPDILCVFWNNILIF